MEYKCVPQIGGKWKFRAVNLTRYKDTVPAFSNIKEVNLILEVEQQDRFVIVKMPSHETRPVDGYRIGVWSKEPNGDWKLILADDDDNGQSVVSVKECKHGKPCVLTGYYIESGYSSENPQQRPTVDYQLWKRIN